MYVAGGSAYRYYSINSVVLYPVEAERVLLCMLVKEAYLSKRMVHKVFETTDGILLT